MTVILAISFILCLVGGKIKGEDQYFEDYMSIGRTNAVKGIFVILVFFRHFAQYVELSGSYDKFFRSFNTMLTQLLVTLFLFYSGFGIMESISKKGKPYLKTIPSKRVPKVLLHFDIAVILYVIAGLAVGHHFGLGRILLSFVCWEAVGNSNWYILAIIVSYLLTYLSFRVIKNKYAAAAVLTALSIGYIILMMHFKKPYWYNTFICYPLGIWYSIFRERLEKIFMKNTLTYFISLSVFLGLFFISYNKKDNSIWIFEGCCLMFVMTAVLLTMKIQLDNGLLQFLGKHLFSLYILQRIPMIIFREVFSYNSHPYVYFIISFFATVILALVFDMAMNKLDKLLFDRKAEKIKSGGKAAKG